MIHSGGMMVTFLCSSLSFCWMRAEGERSWSWILENQIKIPVNIGWVSVVTRMTWREISDGRHHNTLPTTPPGPPTKCPHVTHGPSHYANNYKYSLVLLNILLAASREVHPAPGGWPVSHPWTLHSGVVFTKWKSSITFLPELFTEPWYPIVQSFSFYLAKSDQILLRRLRFRFFSCWRLLTLGSTISSPPGETFQLKLISLSTR